MTMRIWPTLNNIFIIKIVWALTVPSTERPWIPPLTLRQPIVPDVMEMQNDQLKEMSQQVCSTLDGVVILLVIILLVVHLR